MAELLAQVLSEVGHACEIALDGSIGLAKAPLFDLLLVDVMMPVLSGFEMVRQLREEGHRVPIIFLTAKDSTKDIVKGLDLGGDDYLIKPFKLEELLARVNAAIRRGRDTSQGLAWGDLRLDTAKRLAFRNGVEIFLSGTEFSLLEFFMRNPETPLTKARILNEVWQDEGYRDGNIVEVYINYLRRKTEVRGAPRVIHTLKGKGYALTLDEPKP